MSRTFSRTGELPLKVTMRFTQPVETVAGIVDLTSGCRGDGTNAIDLILDIQGDGRTFGGTGDALAVKIRATNIDITGKINCGPRAPGAGHRPQTRRRACNPDRALSAERRRGREQRD